MSKRLDSGASDAYLFDPVPPKKALKSGGLRPVPPGGHVLAHARAKTQEVVAGNRESLREVSVNPRPLGLGRFSGLPSTIHKELSHFALAHYARKQFVIPRIFSNASCWNSGTDTLLFRPINDFFR